MLKAFAGLAAAAVVANAQPAQRAVMMPAIGPSHPDVTTSVALVGATGENVIEAGTVVKAVITMINDADVPLNVSGCIGSLNDAFDYSKFMYNFSGSPVGEVVEAGGEMTVTYTIKTPEAFPSYPFPLQLAMHMYYEDDNSFYTTTFFNETVTFTEESKPLLPSQLSGDALLPTLLTLAALVLTAYFFIDSVPRLQEECSRKKKTAVAVVKAVEREQDAKWESALPARSVTPKRK